MHPPIALPAPRAFSRSVVLWVFGVCTTLLLAGLWGRAVTTDETTLDQSAQAVLNSQIVNHRLEDWILGTVQTLGELPPAEAQSVVQDVVGSPEMDRAVGILVDATVAAALAPPDEPTELDLEPAIEALDPAIDRALRGSGIPVDASVITSTLADLSVSSGELTMASTTVVAARAALTRVVVVASIGLMIAGMMAVFLAENRVEQLRSLFWRLAVSGFTFSVFLRLGAWAVDPSGGRSPVAAGGSVILRSNLDIPFGITLAAVAAAAGFMLVRNRRRAVFEGHPDAEEDDSTGEHRILIDA